MVPGPDVVSVPTDASVSALRETIREAGHTRYPVVTAGDGGQVVGFVDVKDVLAAGDPERDESATAGDLARDVVVVPETTTVADLLVRFQEENQQMAVVIDEWGAFEGLATIEDAVEAIVGDLRDEFDVDGREPSIRRAGDDGYEIDGSVSLPAVADTLGVGFDGEGFDTLGGLVLDRLGRPPEAGDVVSEGGYSRKVLAVDGARVSTVRIRKNGPDGSD